MQQRQEPEEAARTTEIMAKFRPIAPRPEMLLGQPRQRSAIAELHLRSRPSRSRRRTSIPQVPLKHQRITAGHMHPFTPPKQLPVESTKAKVIVPTPMRPVASSISIIGKTIEIIKPAMKTPAVKPELVEEGIEMENFPAIISDKKNRVTMANSAYKEMVGQPECVWFDSMGFRQGRRLGTRRINGVVTLGLPANVSLPENGFSCRVNIEWHNKEKKLVGNVPCEVLKLCCESMNYSFVWRFHINQATVINMEA